MGALEAIVKSEAPMTAVQLASITGADAHLIGTITICNSSIEMKLRRVKCAY